MPRQPILLASNGLRARRIRACLSNRNANPPTVELVGGLSEALAWSNVTSLGGVLIDVAALEGSWLATLEGISQLSSQVPVIVVVDRREPVEADCRSHGACEVLGIDELSPALLQHALTWGAERLALERRLATAHRLETAGRLAAYLAHELNNQLSVICGYGEMLELACRDGDERQRVSEIRRAATSAAACCGRLKGLTVQGPAGLRSVDLNKTIVELQDLLVAAAGELFTVKLRLGESVGRVRIDPFRFQDGLVRLVLDAREAIPQGGTITVATTDATTSPVALLSDESPDCRCVTFSCQAGRADDEAELASGADKASIFTDDGALAHDGLTTMTSFLRQIGGHVEISEEVSSERVSALSLYLPVAQGTTHRAPPSAPPSRDTSSLRVLLVEDDPSVLRLVTRLLEYRGAQVRATADGIEALRHLEIEPFDVLVTDIVMPRLGGIDVVRTARRRQPEIRVLILSGCRPEESGIHELIKDGCAFLEKPFSGGDLSSAISQLLYRGHVAPDDGTADATAKQPVAAAG